MEHKRMEKSFLIVLTIFLTVFPWSVNLAGEESDLQQDLQFSPIPEKRYPKLDSTLAQLVVAWQEGRHPQFAAQRAIEVLPEEKVRVIIEAELGKTDTVKEMAKGLGCKVELDYQNLIQALVPIPKLVSLGEIGEVRRVRLPFRFVPLVESEGVQVINADDWHAQGLYGNGVKVAVLDGGFSGYQALLGTELPSTVSTWWAPNIGGPGTSNHGTACAEIVYDIAPNASFYLANFNTDVEWANAIDWLIGQGADVVSCSMGWLNTGPGDGTGVICQKVTDARNAGILWSNSAGNQARTHWSGSWLDTNGNSWLDFNTSPLDETNTINASAGDQITVGLRWNDPWGASGNDYDLYLLNATLDVVASSTKPQDGNDDPTETLTYTPAAAGTYHIAIWRYSADGSSRFDLFTFRHDLQHQVAAGSLLEPADSPAAMTVGAVPWSDPNTLEYFSSQGPTTDGRTKPDIVAPDGVSTATYGSQNFYGTSASAPHGAGAAALVRERFPSYSPTQVQNYLEANAVELGPAGKDNQYGSGRLFLPAGTPAAFRVERETGNVYADGAYYGSDFHTGSADIAEWVPVSEPVEPGDVLELDPENPGHYRRSRGPCSTLVAGVVSSRPGVVLGSDLVRSSTFEVLGEGQALLALVGIVPVKVTDEGGPIRVGDLLVVSSTPGYAMRWDLSLGAGCAFIGKALEPLEDGTGVILALLMR